jgi:uncharacterized phage protein (TIGR02216 family)
MAAGLGLLRLSPQVLWAMTPREFTAALTALQPAAAAPSRAVLANLNHRFPDQRQTLSEDPS